MIEELVRTILSQNTNDQNSHRAYSNLRKRFPTWAKVAEAQPEDLARTIRVAGLARQKSRVLQEILRRIRREQGRYSIQRVCNKPMNEAREYLLSFKGVGEKTAACVLLFACEKPAFPVDTHILRVSRRLGWLDPRGSGSQAHRFFQMRVPAEKIYSLHLNIIAHGRAICKARKPECETCCLKSRCLFYFRRNHESRS